ncbi:hypothetical protein DEO72_LG6g2035 [Vigna unguiculata]|uniref:Uncharacterized protein n=1 Tax=Vigna unguiculata TaxID=3917 RepID=A0A4D6M7U7_VIGUN|nr:hypothetical protein DEO72_LG6g2035 [Vigna unguiculata]
MLCSAPRPSRIAPPFTEPLSAIRTTTPLLGSSSAVSRAPNRALNRALSRCRRSCLLYTSLFVQRSCSSPFANRATIHGAALCYSNNAATAWEFLRPAPRPSRIAPPSTEPLFAIRTTPPLLGSSSAVSRAPNRALNRALSRCRRSCLLYTSLFVQRSCSSPFANRATIHGAALCYSNNAATAWEFLRRQSSSEPRSESCPFALPSFLSLIHISVVRWNEMCIRDRSSGVVVRIAKSGSVNGGAIREGRGAAALNKERQREEGLRGGEEWLREEAPARRSGCVEERSREENLRCCAVAVRGWCGAPARRLRGGVVAWRSGRARRTCGGRAVLVWCSGRAVLVWCDL